MNIKSIAILGYDMGMPPTDDRYIMSHFRKYWLQQGIDVKVLRGIKENIDADIVLNHVDLTVTPDDYIKYMEKFRYKVNINVRNISKKLYSQNLLTKNDNYDGKVFLKTAANCGGKFDFFIRQAEKHGKPLFNRDRQRNWGTKSFMDSYNYTLFNHIDEVPPDVWDNDNLIVEKFVPEIAENNIYQVRYWFFFGDREINIGVQSDKPVIKGPNITNRFYIEYVPDELREYRSKYGFEYGRFDYSIVDGQFNLFDMNRTPTIGKNMQALFGDRYPSELADGIQAVVESQG